MYFHRVIVAQPIHLALSCDCTDIIIGRELGDDGLIAVEARVLAVQGGRMGLLRLRGSDLENVDQVTAKRSAGEDRCRGPRGEAIL